jgi:AhpD family alkylhydroperoxidase
MQKRLDIKAVEPAAYEAMYALENYLKTIRIDKTLIHLLKIRASQINGCAFCINMHTKEALADGETNQRIFLLNAWRETGIYTDKEKAVLALCEELTLISDYGVTDETYSQVSEYFDEQEIAQLIMATVTINSWNRLSVSANKEIGD